LWSAFPIKPCTDCMESKRIDIFMREKKAVMLYGKLIFGSKEFAGREDQWIQVEYIDRHSVVASDEL
jgi:hypothetical protein